MFKKSKYLWLLLCVVNAFVCSSVAVYADEASQATSKAGIKFVDRRPHDETDFSSGPTDNEQESGKVTNKYPKDLPSTNEKPAVYTTILGVVIVTGSVAIWLKCNKDEDKKC